MISVPFDQVTKETIDELVANGIAEGQELDYKASLYGSQDKDKKELAADVASFANARGGYIVLGVSEKKGPDGQNTGIPDDALGCTWEGQAVNEEKQSARLEMVIRDKLEPRVQAVRIKTIPGFQDGPVFVIHVPRSWSGPHMVKSEDSRFQTRGERGKYGMTITEIRSAFVGGADLERRIRAFRDDRLGRIIADETPIPVKRGVQVAVHLIPFTSMDPSASIDMPTWAKPEDLEPLEQNGWDHAYNLDGFFTFTGARNVRQRGYLQVFRSGAMEHVGTLDDDQEGGRLLHPNWIERDVTAAVARYVSKMAVRGVAPPVAVLVSLLNTRGLVFDRPQSMHSFRPDHPVPRSEILLPDVLIQGPPDVKAVPRLLRPLWDALWQALGVPASPNYDSNGRWNGAGR